MAIAAFAVLLLFVVNAEAAGVYRWGKHKLRLKLELNYPEEWRVEAQYLANATASDGGRISKRVYPERPGHSTKTHTCHIVQVIPPGLRSPDVMRPHGLTNFYQKYTEAYGVPILASSKVPDDALKRACYTVRFMLADRADIREKFYKMSGRVGIMAASEQTLDIPEHSHFDPYMNQRARGLGATDNLPLTTGAEENILCQSHDRYPHEDILLHEFAHAVDNLGAHHVVSNWHQRRQQAYDHSMAHGIWHDTYSETNAAEYFAEGVQTFFSVNAHDAPSDGVHWNVQSELRAHDRQLYDLCMEIWPCNNRYLKRCDSTRDQERAQHLNMDCGGAGVSHATHQCPDNNAHCPEWGHNNECARTPNYMNVHCKFTCDLCHGSQPIGK